MSGSYRCGLEEDSDTESGTSASFESSDEVVGRIISESRMSAEANMTDPNEVPPPQPTLQDLFEALLIAQRSAPPKVTDIVKLSEFNGQRSEWDSWKLIARNKIAVDGPSMPSDVACFSAIHSKIQGNAARTIAAYATEKINNGTANATELLDYLEGIYGDPARVQRSITELHSIKQAENESFATYLPRFESVLSHAKGGNWPENIKIAFLLPSLSAKYHRHLPGSKSYTVYRDLTTDLQNIGSRVAADDAYDKRSRPHSLQQSVPRSNTHHRAEPMEGVTYTGPPRVNTTTNSHCSCKGFNHSCGRRRASWVTQETRHYRRTHKLCMRCGHQGHFESNCKFLPAVNPARTNVTNISFDPALSMPEPTSAEESEKE